MGYLRRILAVMLPALLLGAAALPAHAGELRTPRAAAAPSRARAATARGRRAVLASLAREMRGKRIRATDLRRWRRYYALSARTLRKLSGARAAQLDFAPLIVVVVRSHG